jgi:hypothetical protein
VGNNNGDVDRAMAAFAASPMPYYNFKVSEARSSAAPVSGAGVAPANPVRSEHAVAFPLLLAALPEFGEASMPFPPSGADTVTAKPPISPSASGKTELTTRIALDRPVTRPSNVVSDKKHNVASALPARPAQAAKPASQPAPDQRNAKTGSTPIAAMFHALNGSGPPHHGSSETGTGLQDILSRL